MLAIIAAERVRKLYESSKGPLVSGSEVDAGPSDAQDVSDQQHQQQQMEESTHQPQQSKLF